MIFLLGQSMPFADTWAQVITLFISSFLIPALFFYIEMKRREWAKEDKEQKAEIKKDLEAANRKVDAINDVEKELTRKVEVYKSLRREDVKDVQEQALRRKNERLKEYIEK